MPEESITQDFVVTNKRDVEALFSALMKKNKLPEPVKSVSGKESVRTLMEKWRKNNGRD